MCGPSVGPGWGGAVEGVVGQVVEGTCGPEHTWTAAVSPPHRVTGKGPGGDQTAQVGPCGHRLGTSVAKALCAHGADDVGHPASPSPEVHFRGVTAV